MIAIGSGGAPLQELQHELPTSRVNDRGFVVGTRHNRRRAVRLWGPRRGIYRHLMQIVAAESEAAARHRSYNSPARTDELPTTDWRARAMHQSSPQAPIESFCVRQQSPSFHTRTHLRD